MINLKIIFNKSNWSFSKILSSLPPLIGATILLIVGQFLGISMAIVVPLVLSLFFLYIIFKPFVVLESEITFRILEKILPDIHKASSSITTLSAGAILLTFSIIRVFGKVSENILYKDTLIMSWYFFGGCIGIGVIIGVIIYILRTQYLVLFKTFKDSQKSESESKEEQKRFRTLLKRTRGFQRALFVCASLQPIMFFISMYYAISFAIKNI